MICCERSPNMAVRIIPQPDYCADRMVSNPSGYFEDARERLHAEVVEDMNGRRDQRKSR
jgi:hypothetical protein